MRTLSDIEKKIVHFRDTRSQYAANAEDKLTVLQEISRLISSKEADPQQYIRDKILTIRKGKNHDQGASARLQTYMWCIGMVRDL